MNWLADWMRDKHELKVNLLIEEGADVQSAEVRAFLLHSIRELLFNVVKHAGVNTATLEIQRHDEQVWARVVDQGAGYDTRQRRPSSNGTGFGLSSIHDRLELMGGCLEIESAPGRGTRMTIVVPVHLPAPAPQEVPQS
jgi:signal transduction histidine kinase